MAQDSPKRKSRRGRVALALFVLLVMGAMGVIGAAGIVLDTNRQRILKEAEQGLGSRSANTAANITVWAGRTKSQVEDFVDLDMLRLFAAELDNAKISVEQIRQLGAKADRDFSSPAEADDVDSASAGQVTLAVDRIILHLPVMQNQIKEFAAKNAFVNAALLNRNMEVYLSATDGATAASEHGASLEAVFTGKRSVFLPVRLHEGVLLMDMIFPVEVPPYVSPDEYVVAALLVTCDVTRILRDVTRRAPEGGGLYNACVMQEHGKNLQIIAEGVGGPQLIDLPHWRLEADRSLPLALRQMPVEPDKSVQVYSIAMPVPDLPWYAVEMLNAGKTEADYADFRRNVIIMAVLLIALIAIVLMALWWWALGRRERVIAEEMRHLYQMVHQQKQIMDGVNSALSAGIVLNDLNGVIYYANQSFVHMTGLTQQDLSGLSYKNLNVDMARSLVTHTQAVYQSRKLASFTEILPVSGGQRHFLTSCSPFLNEKGEFLGVVSVYNDIMDLVMAQRRAQHMVTQTVAVFVRAIEAVDPYLCGQSSFTAKLAVALALHLDKGDDVTLATLRTAASLSQIGMIQLPRELLTKTGKLSADERAQLERHVEYTRAALEGIDFGIPVLEAISQMYERMDGSGYPIGLKDSQISLNARILGVANTFCALMRPRSYRSALDTRLATEMLSTTPPKYDPDVVSALTDFLGTDQGQVFLRQLAGERSDSPEQT
ncbi:MAG: PAS domain-containing protein [Desulfovibrio sp.]|jgi:PAS domain S-box-containing protein|nr:PAS domain-containing protein [Desulfovibrio sp.]